MTHFKSAGYALKTLSPKATKFKQGWIAVVSQGINESSEAQQMKDEKGEKSHISKRNI